MHPSELQLGDIICFHSDSKWNEIEHIAMYTGIIEGKHYVTHSIINDTPGLQTTILKDDRRMDVFRPVNAELGVRAAQRLLAWAKYRIPYDSRRANLMIEIKQEVNMRALRQDKEEAIDYILRYYSEIAKIKFYERIKFAARRNTCPVKMIDGIQSRGITCAQAVMLAYQVEEEQLVQCVKTLEQVKNELAPLSTTIDQITNAWISDKDCSSKFVETYDLPKSYVKYATALRSSEEFSDFCIRNKRVSTFAYPNYHPSLVAWDFAKEPSIDLFIKNFDSCLDLPAKICPPSVLFWFMQKNSRHWINVGSLDNNLLPFTFSHEEKQKHRTHKAQLELEIAYNRSQIYGKLELYNHNLKNSIMSFVSSPSSDSEKLFANHGLPTRSRPPGVRTYVTGIESQEEDSINQSDIVAFSPIIARKFDKKSLKM